MTIRTCEGSCGIARNFLEACFRIGSWGEEVTASISRPHRRDNRNSFVSSGRSGSRQNTKDSLGEYLFRFAPRSRHPQDITSARRSGSLTSTAENWSWSSSHPLAVIHAWSIHYIGRGFHKRREFRVHWCLRTPVAHPSQSHVCRWLTVPRRTLADHAAQRDSYLQIITARAPSHLDPKRSSPPFRWYVKISRFPLTTTRPVATQSGVRRITS